MCLNDRGNVTGLKLPAFGEKLFCQSTWLDLLDIKSSTFGDIRRSLVRTRDAVRDPHGQTGEQRALRSDARQNIRAFLQSLADPHAQVLPMYLSAAHGGQLGPEEYIMVLPPSFSREGMWQMYQDSTKSVPNLCISRRQFSNILKDDMPFIRVSRCERGICDLCMAYRGKSRMVDDDNVTKLSESWSVHLALAVTARDEHNRCREIAKSIWVNRDEFSIARADLSVDYAEQAHLPVILSATFGDFFVQTQELDVNLFGILNEGSGKHTTMVSTEGARHDSNAVVSQLHHYVTNIDCAVGKAGELFLHMDSCGGQNKNNIMLGYCMLHLIDKYHRRIVLKFMTVGHTKFGPDRIFGCIRQQMKSSTALSIAEFKTLIESSAESSQAYVFDHKRNTRDYKSGTKKLFRNLPGFCYNFYYSIVIERESKSEKVVVKTSVSPGDVTEASHYLQKPSTIHPALNDDFFFLIVPAKPINASCRKSLRNVISEHIKSRFPNRNIAVDSWWLEYLRSIDAYGELFTEQTIQPTIRRSAQLGVSARSGAHALGAALTQITNSIEIESVPPSKRTRFQ